MNQSVKRLYRSNSDSVICGVCGGLGEYFKVDPVVVRLAWVIFTILTAIIPSLLVYALAYVIIPKEPVSRVSRSDHQGSSGQTIEVDPAGS